MTLRGFRRMVVAEFGPNMENATPSNVREFLDKLQAGRSSGKSNGRLRLDEASLSYEGILPDFFARSLDLPSEEAVIALWTFALELAFADLKDVLEERFGALFQGIDEP